MIICEDCYTLVEPEDRRARRELVPIERQDCFACGVHKDCRRNVDNGMAFCDGCMEAMYSEEVRQEQQRKRGAGSPVVLPDEVAPGVFVGPKESAMDLATLRELGITTVLVCCHRLPFYHSHETAPELTYHRLPLQDSLGQGDLQRYFQSSRALIAQAIASGGKALVHCNAGVSRSGIVAVDWVMYSQGLALEAALAAVKAVRPIVHPNAAFLKQAAAGAGAGTGTVGPN